MKGNTPFFPVWQLTYFRERKKGADKKRVKNSDREKRSRDQKRETGLGEKKVSQPKPSKRGGKFGDVNKLVWQL